MRRFPLIILGLLLPLELHAAAALSPWVQGVLDHVKAGELTAASVRAGTCSSPEEATPVLAEIDEQVRLLLGSPIDRLDTTAFLRERTVCAEHDRRLLLAALKRTADAALRDAAQCHRSAASVSVAVLEYLSEAYRSFLAGVDDPTVTDARLRMFYAFENSTLWTNGPWDPVFDPLSTAPLCPFTTDYAPHTIATARSTYAAPTPQIGDRSYGCDLAVLRCLAPAPGQSAPASCDPDVTASADPIVRAEANTLAQTLEHIDATARPLYRALSTARQTLEAIIAALTGGTPPSGGPPPALPPAPHGVLNGCLRPPAPATSQSDDAHDIDAALASTPQYTDDWYLTALGLNPATASANPPPHQLMPWWLLLRSSPRMPMETLLSFADAREADGTMRPLPSDWSPTQDTHPFWPQREQDATELRLAGGNIARETAVFDAISREALEQSRSATAPLHEAVRSLATVTEEFLPTEYLPSLVYFLLRSCSGGPCEARLKAIAQRSFNPYCHPFLSGKFLEKDVPEKCFCLGQYANEPYCKG